MPKRFLFYSLMVVGALTYGSCKPATSHKQPSPTPTASPAATPAVDRETQEGVFPYPRIPSILTSPAERRAYLLAHYWDAYDFTDTLLLHTRDVTEQGFVNHIALLADGQSTEAEVTESLDNLCRAMLRTPEARRVFMQLFDSYLFDPNSPFYNEALYLVYLNCMLGQPALDETRKSTLAFRKQLVSRNRPGQPATDFTYYLPDGQARSLRQTAVQGEHLILVFYDPECPGCHEVMQTIHEDDALAQAVAARQLTVLAIYTEGNRDAWLKDLPNMPAGWIVGTDREAIKAGALYDLKAMPSLYLLDKEKRVLLKDAAYSRIREEVLP